MKAEYTYTRLAPLPPKREGKSTKFNNIYDKSSFLSYRLYLISKACNNLKKTFKV